MSTISASTTSTTAYKVTADTTGNLVLQTGSGPTTAVTVDTSQNVGIGTSSPSQKFHVSGGYSLLNGLRISGADTANTIYQATGNLFLTTDGSGANITMRPNFGVFTVNPGGTEAMRVDSSGNVGIGTSSPQTRLQVSSPTTTASGSSAWESTGATLNVFYTGAGATDAGASINLSTLAVIKGAQDASGGGNGYLSFMTRNGNAGQYATERARIDPSGNLLVGLTSALGSLSGAAQIANANNQQVLYRNTGATAGKFFYTGVGSTNYFSVYNNSNTGVYLADGGTSWTANSDERLKDIIELISDATSKVCELRAVIGKYKSDEAGVRRSFLIAQDVNKVLPEAVTTHRLPDDDTEYLGVAYTDVIPLLVAAIQELNAKVEAQAAEIAQLKGQA